MQVSGPSGQGQVQPPILGKNTVAEPHTPAPQGQVVSADAAPFISPVVNFDYQSGIAVLEVRDGSTGEVVEQYPSKKVVEEYRRHGASSQEPGTAASPAQPSGQAGSPDATPSPQLVAATGSGQGAAPAAPAPEAPAAAGIAIDS
jgi:hypothetical protein